MVDDLDEIEDVRLMVPASLIYKVFPAYYDHGILPEAGGSLDQDDDIMDALNIVMYLISWHVENEKKRDPDSMPTIDDIDSNPVFPPVMKRK